MCLYVIIVLYKRRKVKEKVMNNLCKKVIASVLALAMLTSGLIFTQSKSADVKAADEWNLVWSDEFEGTSLDTSVWNYEIGNGNWGWGNGEKQYYTNSVKNVEVSNGTLKIHALKERMGNQDYTSGRINTKGKKDFKFGRIEARMKLPSFSGAWPAFWMLGANHSSVGWPKCGELDIMEAINTQNFTNGAVHWYVESEGYNGQGDNGDSAEGKTPAGYQRTEWHTYGVEWDKKEIKWYIDDKVFFTQDISASHMDEFRKNQFIIFNLAIGGQWPGYNIDDSAFPSRSTMEVDYVRVYQKAEVPTTKYDGPTITITEDAVEKYTGKWNSFFGSDINWVPAKGSIELGDTPSEGFTMNLTSVGNIQNDSVWGAQATLERLNYYPGNTYKYSCTLTSDKDKKVFVKVADDNEETLGGGLIDLKAGVPYNFETNVEIPEDFEGTVSLKFGMGKTNGDTIADNGAVTIHVKDISFVTTATIPDPDYVQETTAQNPKETTTNNGTTTKSPVVKPTINSSVKVAKTKVKKATKKKVSKKVKLTLKKIKGATGYKVQFSKTKKFKKVLVSKTVKKAKITVLNKKLRKQKKLYVRAKAYRTVGKVKYYSKKWSAVKKVKIKK
ncbi:MAG: glycoside hydrolase family 16 protein [Eubacterium sp.]|nr:glycoside hydrolase family 16 protein [Eubacterium sp.]